MSHSTNEPVEISTRMREGEWTPESLSTLVASYQQKLADMGAAPADILTEVNEPGDGSARVKVSWQHSAADTAPAGIGADATPDTGEVAGEATESRGHGEAIPAGEATEDSQGLGAVYGDAERSAIDAPPTARAQEAARTLEVPDVVIRTKEDGTTYAEEAPA